MIYARSLTEVVAFSDHIYCDQLAVGPHTALGTTEAYNFSHVTKQ